VLVTDEELTRYEYCFWKGYLAARGIELVSTRHEDGPELSKCFVKLPGQSKARQPFGYRMTNGVVSLIPGYGEVIERIVELREQGYTLRRIQEDEKVCHPDGRRLSLTTIDNVLWRHRGKK
jgi:hypothetical protein